MAEGSEGMATLEVENPPMQQPIPHAENGTSKIMLFVGGIVGILLIAAVLGTSGAFGSSGEKGSSGAFTAATPAPTMSPTPQTKVPSSAPTTPSPTPPPSTVVPSPAPTTLVPTPSPTSLVSHPINVLSYNLAGGRQPVSSVAQQLYEKMNNYGPYALMGFQESDDVEVFMTDYSKSPGFKAGWSSDFGYAQTEASLGMAYDKNMLEPLTDYKLTLVVPGARRRRMYPCPWDANQQCKKPGLGCGPEDHCPRDSADPSDPKYNMCAGTTDVPFPGPCDPHGDRFVSYRRFRFKDSTATVLFANLHGALYNCGESHTTDNQKLWAKGIGMNMTKACTDNADPNDAIILTGDFNCNHDSAEMEYILSQFNIAAQGVGGISGYDHVFIHDSKNAQTYINITGMKSEDGKPSDHNILVSNIGVHGSSDGLVQAQV